MCDVHHHMGDSTLVQLAHSIKLGIYMMLIVKDGFLFLPICSFLALDSHWWKDIYSPHDDDDADDFCSRGVWFSDKQRDSTPGSINSFEVQIQPITHDDFHYLLEITIYYAYIYLLSYINITITHLPMWLRGINIRPNYSTLWPILVVEGFELKISCGRSKSPHTWIT